MSRKQDHANSLSVHVVPSSQSGSVRRAVVAALVIAAAAFGIWRHLHPGGAQNAAPQTTRGERPSPGARPQPVQARPAEAGDLDIYLTGLGTITAANTVTVRSRVDGQLMRLHFQEGQAVKAGDLLAEIDPRPFQVQLTQAEGQMAKDQAALKNAQQDLARYKALLAEDSISRQQLDTQAALVRQLEGTVKADQGLIDSAKLQLAYCRITAPAGGRLGLRQIDAGNMVHASDAGGIVTITQVKPISVIFSIPEPQLPSVLKPLHAGQAIPVEAWDREQKSRLAQGKLLTVDNQIDVGTGTIRLKGQFANEDELLFPNQFVNVRMRVATLRQAVLAPGEAVQRGGQGPFVYVVNADRTVSVRPVRLGPSEGGRVAVEEGVKAGELLVVDGVDKLRDGARVELPNPS